ncbi:MAG: DUF4167 domain-containing protein [Pseudomonadota bacterium]
MRSSKSRSRNKPNRNRSVGNIVNRVFESSGPEGKVRGTPQQIIEKYNQLARDSQLSGDRVASENFQQHAEHYLRMLGEAQREQDQRRDEQERQNRDRQADRDKGEPDKSDRDKPERTPARDHDKPEDPAQSTQPDVLDSGSGSDAGSGLVETPETQETPAPQPPKRARKPRARKPAPVKSDQDQDQGDQDQGAGNETGDASSDQGPTKATG